MSTSSGDVSRILALVPYLQRNPNVTVADVTRTFGISKAQLRKDLGILSWVGLPGLHYGDYIEIDLEAVDGTGVINLSNADYFARPLRLSADEAVALLLALRSVREVADPQQWEVIDSVVAKLAEVAGEAAGAADRAHVAINSGDEEIRLAVHSALRTNRQLELVYDVAARAETTTRVVDPLRASVRDGNAYVDAWCYRAQALRSFRMDRIQTAQVLDTAAAAHPDVTLPELSGQWFADQGELDIVELTVIPQVRWIAEAYPTAEIVAESATEVQIRIGVADPSWLRALLLGLGEAVVSVAPAATRQALAEVAHEVVEQYRALGLLPSQEG